MSIPVNRSLVGAASTAHPFATQAALDTLEAGGSAVDAAIAAHAVIATVMPDAAGLGGDLLALVRSSDGSISAVNGTGLSPAVPPSTWATDGGASITVPGLVDAWCTLSAQWGRMPLTSIFSPAIRIATEGYVLDEGLAQSRDRHRERLIAGGASSWELLSAEAGSMLRQPALASLLEQIGRTGRSAFYRGDAAAAIARAASAHGGTLTVDDLAAHRTSTPPPVEVPWNGERLVVQPPASQGVLLAVAAQWLDAAWTELTGDTSHVMVEATEAAFQHRDKAAGNPAALLDLVLDVDREVAARRGGPRGYLHTAGVAVADRSGMVVSSLISVFDDFGSGVFVRELGVVLNNRAAGFTSADNCARPSARPVHTLAPAMLIGPGGDTLAIATPGADGQVQTLLQVMVAMRSGASLDAALAAPRWRSEDGRLLIESTHTGAAELASRGHDLQPIPAGDSIFGAVVAAGYRHGEPYAAADPRRGVSAAQR